MSSLKNLFTSPSKKGTMADIYNYFPGRQGLATDVLAIMDAKGFQLVTYGQIVTLPSRPAVTSLPTRLSLRRKHYQVDFDDNSSFVVNESFICEKGYQNNVYTVWEQPQVFYVSKGDVSIQAVGCLGIQKTTGYFVLFNVDPSKLDLSVGFEVHAEVDVLFYTTDGTQPAYSPQVPFKAEKDAIEEEMDKLNYHSEFMPQPDEVVQALIEQNKLIVEKVKRLEDDLVEKQSKFMESNKLMPKGRVKTDLQLREIEEATKALLGETIEMIDLAVNEENPFKKLKQPVPPKEGKKKGSIEFGYKVTPKPLLTEKELGIARKKFVGEGFGSIFPFKENN